FQFGACLGDLIDLRQNRIFIGVIGTHQWLHLQLRLLYVGAQINQRHPMLLQNSIHRLALIVGQLEALHNLRIVPELPPCAVKPESPFHRRPMLAKAGAHPWSARSLSCCQSPSNQRDQCACQRKSKSSCKNVFHLFLLPNTSTFKSALVIDPHCFPSTGPTAPLRPEQSARYPCPRQPTSPRRRFLCAAVSPTAAVLLPARPLPGQAPADDGARRDRPPNCPKSAHSPAPNPPQTASHGQSRSALLCAAGYKQHHSRHAHSAGSCRGPAPKPNPQPNRDLLPDSPPLSPHVNSSFAPQFRTHLLQSPRKMRLYRAFAQSRGESDIAQLLIFHVAQQENRPLPLAQSPNRLPDCRNLLARQNLLLGCTFSARQPLACLVQIHPVALRMPPELQPAVTPVVLLQVDGDPHQPGHRA